MTLDELPGYLRMLAARAGDAAIPAANAMGSGFEKEVKRRLTRVSHQRPSRTPVPPGEPPAMESGTLAGSVAMVPASTPVVATSSVSPHTIYDWVQEYGAEIHAKRSGYMKFWYPELRFEKVVTIPERSYMRSTVELMVADGSLARAAADAFYVYMWG